MKCCALEDNMESTISIGASFCGPTRDLSLSCLHEVWIEDALRKIYLFNVNSSQKVIFFLFLHVVSMLGNVVAILENIVST